MKKANITNIDQYQSLSSTLPSSLVVTSIHCKFSSAPSHDHKVFRLVNLSLRTWSVPSSLLFARDYKVTADVKFDGANVLGVSRVQVYRLGE